MISFLAHLIYLFIWKLEVWHVSLHSLLGGQCTDYVIIIWESWIHNDIDRNMQKRCRLNLWQCAFSQDGHFHYNVLRMHRLLPPAIRRMGEGNSFSLFTSWGGGGVPGLRSGGGVPHLRSGGVPVVPPRISKHLLWLRGGRYASCVHAGGLSCY